MTDAEPIGPGDLSRLKPLSTLELRFVPLDFVMHWHRCGLAADYVAAHQAYTFEHREVARAILSTVVNELIENAVKFSADKAQTATVTLTHFGEWLAVETRNRTDARRAGALSAVVQALQGQSAEALFLERIASPHVGEGSPSGLGLLVLKKDYGAHLIIQTNPGENDSFEVLVQAVINTAELEAR